MSGDQPRPGGRDEPTPDFDARWRELAEELDRSLPPDLRDWVDGRPQNARAKDGQAAHAAAQDPVQASDPDDTDQPDERTGGAGTPFAGGRIVWAASVGGADGIEWSESFEDLEDVEDSLTPEKDGRSLGPRDWIPPAVEDHFEPPDAPPVLDGNPILVLSWIGLIGGLTLVFGWAMFGAAFPAWLARAGLVAIVAGVAGLIWKMPHDRDPDQDDDGAQV